MISWSCSCREGATKCLGSSFLERRPKIRGKDKKTALTEEERKKAEDEKAGIDSDLVLGSKEYQISSFGPTVSLFE